MLVYSNDVNNEQLQFKFYDHETDTVYEVSDTVDFELNLALGDVLNPFELNVYLGIDVEFSLGEGWNWMSLNIYTDDMSASRPSCWRNKF